MTQADRWIAWIAGRSGCKTQLFVAQISLLLYRRIAFGRARRCWRASRWRSARGLQIFPALVFEGLRKIPCGCDVRRDLPPARARNGARGVKLGQAATIRQVS